MRCGQDVSQHSHLRIWGCLAYVKYLKTNKLESKSDKYLFVGYPKETKGYYFYLADEQKVFVSNRTVFLEKKILGEETNASKIELDEVRLVEESIQSSKPIESDLIKSNLELIIEISLRRFGRVSHQLDRYYDFLVRDRDPVELDENNEDPIIYMDVMQRSNSDKWLKAMKFEMESMKINNVWILVNPPEGVKPIGCKQIFKKKRDAD